MKRVWDKDFKYTKQAHQTVEHLRAVFARERKRLADEEESRSRSTGRRDEIFRGLSESCGAW